MPCNFRNAKFIAANAQSVLDTIPLHLTIEPKVTSPPSPHRLLEPLVPSPPLGNNTASRAAAAPAPQNTVSQPPFEENIPIPKHRPISMASSRTTPTSSRTLFSTRPARS
eukprot:scaffold9015_cov60-Phaeocystis_antarctica.AAC.2